MEKSINSWKLIFEYRSFQDTLIQSNYQCFLFPILIYLPILLLDGFNIWYRFHCFLQLFANDISILFIELFKVICILFYNIRIALDLEVWYKYARSRFSVINRWTFWHLWLDLFPYFGLKQVYTIIFTRLNWIIMNVLKVIIESSLGLKCIRWLIKWFIVW